VTIPASFVMSGDRAVVEFAARYGIKSACVAGRLVVLHTDKEDMVLNPPSNVRSVKEIVKVESHGIKHKILLVVELEAPHAKNKHIYAFVYPKEFQEVDIPPEVVEMAMIEELGEEDEFDCIEDDIDYIYLQMEEEEEEEEGYDLYEVALKDEEDPGDGIVIEVEDCYKTGAFI